MQLHTSGEDGFGRLVFEFRGRLDLPGYKVSFDNNVLAIIFAEPVTLPLPDVSATLPQFLTIGRVDPDGKGVRFGLRVPVSVHSMEAGERLFVDLMPANWQGLPPSLPTEVIAELSERAKNAAIVAEQERKAEQAKALNPRVDLRVGRNPTFTRVQFDWSVETRGTFKQDGAHASIVFDWPVPVDLYTLKADLPSEVMGVSNRVTPSGSSVEMTLVEGVVPRFYTENNQQFTLDIDLSAEEAQSVRTTAEAAAQQAEEEAAAALAKARAEAANAAANDAQLAATAQAEIDESGRPITPVIDDQGGTVRVKFPFERDTASAVFRRGDTLWMLFDTRVAINQPA